MKILHISDIHLGKKLNNMSLEEDQKYWIDRFLEKTDEIQPDVIVAAGDIYDRAAPVDDAVALLDYMVTEISARKIPLVMIAGNHDSGQKLSFAGSVLERGGVYIEGVPGRKMKCVELEDEHGPVCFWLMPYFFPALVKQVFDRDDIRDYESACRALIEAQDIDKTKRNILVAHQSVTVSGEEAERDGSETAVGGVGNMDFHLFDDFDYVALGHIHYAQKAGRNEIRYSGSPVPYNFYEYGKISPEKYNDRGALLIETGAKGEPLKIERVQIPLLHKLRVLMGTMDELKAEIEAERYRDEYIKVIVTDTKLNPSVRADLADRVGMYGSYLAETLYRPEKLRTTYGKNEAEHVEDRSTFELFMEFYSEFRDGEQPDEKEEALIKHISDLIDSTAEELSPEAVASNALEHIYGKEGND